MEQQNLGSSEDEVKKETETYNNAKEDRIFMIPQTVKGIKSIEKDQIRKERAALMQP